MERCVCVCVCVCVCESDKSYANGNYVHDFYLTLLPDLHLQGQTCSICFEPWSNSGNHRIASLKCGHLFGHKYVLRPVARDLDITYLAMI